MRNRHDPPLRVGPWHQDESNMNHAATDRTLRTALGAVLVFQTACLAVLWTWALDASPASTLGAVAATLLGLCATARMAPRAVRLARRAGTRVGLSAPATIGAGVAICGLCSTGAVLAAPAMGDALVAGVLWSRVTWLAACGALQLVGMAPMALGLAATLGRDETVDLALPCRAASCGLAAFAAAWWLGMSLAALPVVTGLLLLAGSVIIVRRWRGAAEHEADTSPPPPAARRRRLGWACIAGGTLVLTAAGSLVADLTELGPAWSIALVAACLGAVGWRPHRRAARGLGPAQASLRVAGAASAMGVTAVLIAGAAGLTLPTRDTGWRKDAIGQVLAEVLARCPAGQRLWVVASSPRDVPAAMPPQVVTMRAAVDPASLGDGDPGRALRGEFGGEFLAAVRAGRERYDGVVLAPARADGPLAWRCYAQRTLRLCARRLGEGPAVILRTQAARENCSDVLALAATFRRVFGPGWMAVAWGEGQMDVLLVAGGAATGARPERRRGLVVVDLEALRERWPEVKPLRMTHPRGVLAPSPTARAFGQWLRGR